MKFPEFKLERYFARYEFQAPHLLCASDCESVTVDELIAQVPGAHDELLRCRLGYTESTGDPELRAEIAKLYRHISPEEVLVFAGAEEGIFAFMNTALLPGDRLIVHTPCYQSLAAVAAAAGCEVLPWLANESQGWALDVDFLAEAVDNRTRAVVLNCPHNPTGYLMCRDDFQSVIDIARRHGLFLFSDEVYRRLEYDARDRLPAACDLYENAVSLGVLSKAYGLAGLRIGWVATRNAGLLQRMAAFKDYTTICSSAPSEVLAKIALRCGEQLLARNVQIIRRNSQQLATFFDDYRTVFAWIPPRAGCIAFPRLDLSSGAAAFCRRAVEGDGVFLLPSGIYDYGDQHFRIGFGRKNFAGALGALRDFLEKDRQSAH